MALTIALRRLLTNETALPITKAPNLSAGSPRLFSKCMERYVVKVGILEFLQGIGKGLDVHAPKLETRIRDLQRLLTTRTRMLKGLGIPCKHRKLILRYANYYRLGLWRPLRSTMKRQ